MKISSGIEAKIASLLKDREGLKKLLLLEKEKRGISKEKVVFIGMANVARYYWCAIYSLLASKKNELNFFALYLEDRIRHSYNLGYFDKFPKQREKILEIGDQITFDDIEKLLENQTSLNVTMDAITKMDKDGKKIMIINPVLSDIERIMLEAEVKKDGIQIGKNEDFPLEEGVLLHTSKAQQHPTIRWNFNWENYVVTGEPDGITKKFVYEFKHTRNKFLMNKVTKGIAFAQADLYGYFFKRKLKKVQIYIEEDDEIKTWEKAVDVNHALETLTKFKSVEEGIQPILPAKWKCKHCEFREECKYAQV